MKTSNTVEKLNQQLGEFKTKFDPIIINNLDRDRAKKAAQVLAEYCPQILIILSKNPDLEGLMNQWKEIGGNHSPSRHQLESAGVQLPYELGYFFGIGVETAILDELAQISN